MLAYPVDLIPDEDTLRIRCVDLPELNTFGDDADEALFQARDALQLAVSMRIRRHKDIPDPSPAEGRPTIALSFQAALKVLVYRAMREEGLTASALARRLGKRETQVRRLLDLDHGSAMRQIEEAMAALGRRLDVTVEKTDEPRAAAQ